MDVLYGGEFAVLIVVYSSSTLTKVVGSDQLGGN